jgi:hypothetical protein
MTTTTLIDMYHKGAITADHLMVHSLHLIDPADPALALDPFPRELLVKALDFAREYRPSAMATNYGTLPGPAQVEAAKKWIEATLLSDPVRIRNR